MDDTPRFPLLAWEGSPQCETEFQNAKERLETISGRLPLRNAQKIVELLGFNMRGDIGVYVDAQTDGHPMPRTMYDAHAAVLRFGSPGFWSVSDFEALADREGPIVRRGMLGFGYRPHKQIAHRWVKLEKRDRKTFVQEQVPYVHAEADRLESLRTHADAPYVSGDTYSLRINNANRIHIAMHVVLSGKDERFMELSGLAMRNRMTVANVQDGFTIDAKTVYVPNAAHYIRATRSDGALVERLWPLAVKRDALIPLAQDLVDRVRAA